MNYLEQLNHLQNRYFILRHGESEANAAHLIIGNAKAGIAGYGLTGKGKQQVIASAEEAKRKNWLDSATIIYSSDFKRAVETAETAREVLGAGKIHLTQALRERDFGTWEGKHNKNYMRVWSKDVRGVDHQDGTESIFSVRDRVTRLIVELESRYQGKTILLVSHGDPLHILQTAFADVKPTKHRLLKHMSVAEIRELIFKSPKP